MKLNFVTEVTSKLSYAEATPNRLKTIPAGRGPGMETISIFSRKKIENIGYFQYF